MRSDFTVDHETVYDALAALRTLRANTRVDPERTFIIGHSLGASLAPRIGIKDKRAAGLVLLAPFARSILDTYRDQTLVEVNRNNEAVLKKQLEATQDRFSVGEVTRTDVAQAQSSLAQATANRIASEGQLEVSRAEYTRAVGHPPGRLTRAAGPSLTPRVGSGESSGISERIGTDQDGP